MEQLEVELGCGVPEHDLSCLCDVIITNPLPPITESIKDGVRDLWMGKEICDIKGYGVPWTRESILDYLVDLETFYDAYHYSKHKFMGDSLWETEPINFKNEDSTFVHWQQVREVVQYAMDKFQDCLTDIMEYYELEPQFLMDSLTTGKAGDGWDTAKVAELDYLMMQPNINFRSVAKQIGLSIDTVNGLRKYWIDRRERLVGGDKPARARLHYLAKNTELPANDIVNIVIQEYGVTYSRAAVNKVRERHRKGL